MRLSLCLLVTAAVLLPLPGPPLHAQGARRSAPKNVVAGTLSAVDAAAGTVTLTPRGGAPQSFRLTDATRILAVKRAVPVSALKVGESIVVRFRKSASGLPSLYDLCDKASWEWLDRIRHEPTRVTLRAIGEDELKATEGPDQAEVAYRVTEKTQWARGGKAAARSDFKAGETACVIPRMLPSGAIMAAAVSDSEADAAKLKERARTIVTGVVRSADAGQHALVILSAAGDERRFALDPSVVVRRSSKDVGAPALRAGLTVTVHFRRQLGGDDLVYRITIQTSKATHWPAK